MRYVSFKLAGHPEITIRLSEQVDGTLLFEIDASAAKGNVDLRGIFFDVRDPTLLSNLSITGADVTQTQFGDEDVTNLGSGVNMNGNPTGAFDAGVAFGSSGKSGGTWRRPRRSITARNWASTSDTASTC